MYASLEELSRDILSCTACPLWQSRTRGVPGEGNPGADLMFVGEGPGAEEDLAGRPFVGAAGQLLDRILEAIDLTRDDVYIANIVKCRPPGNRNPTEHEAGACLLWLRHQVRLIRPRIIVCLGTVAAQNIIDPGARVTRIRGRFIERRGYFLFATYHPAALLRDERLKVDAWKDFRAIRDKLREIGKR